MKRYTLSSSVSELPGVGATRKKQLEKLGVSTLKDLVYLFPRAYENRGDVKELKEADSNITSSFILTVASEVRTNMLRRGLTISKFRAFDESGSCNVVFFNSQYIKDVFHIGSVFRFYGKIELNKKTYTLTNPKFEPVIDGIPLPDLIPVYPLTEGITSKFIDKITKTAIDEVIDEIIDPLNEEIRIKNELPVLSYAIKNIHFPESRDALQKAVRRLAFDEMFLFGVNISLSAKIKSKVQGVPFKPCDFSSFKNLFPYEFTNSQKQAINDIYRDTVRKNGENPPSMARIIVGDVGCGKTVCAFAAIYLAINSGYQAAMMAPTEILARQHYNEAGKIFSKLGIKIELLLGSTTSRERARINAELESGTPVAVFGTHALISEKTKFANLGLAITDEQHRFGVEQRAVLREKSKNAHLLVMSATPIPRTLALTLYGDLDVSRITDMPLGRSRVDTFVVDNSYRERLNDFISKQVENGGQCYVVCPAIEKSIEDDSLVALNSIKSLTFDRLKNITNTQEHTEYLRQNLKGLRIECLHGKLKTSEKDDIMARFISGEIDVLVSTTVIEVGVNVPNASLVVVECADRFGLSQLHQLRGRVGRGSRKSYCVLVSSLNSEKAKERLEIMRTTYDGYEIAEKDLIMRGPGDFFAGNDGMRQSGGFEFNIAKMCDDANLFTIAFSSAKDLVMLDPDLEKEENKELKKLLNQKLNSHISTIS